jgi:hypothetical protein
MEFQTETAEKIKTQFYVQHPPPQEIVPLYEIMWEIYGRAGQVTDDNMAHALCMLGI